MMEAVRSTATLILSRVARRTIPENGILHGHRRENLKSYIVLTGWALYWRRNVSPVRYELGFYIPEDTTFRKPHLFLSSDEGRATTALLGPLEGANLNHWTKGPREKMYPFNEDGNSFRNVVF
jgi:hypothetical protein